MLTDAMEFHHYSISFRLTCGPGTILSIKYASEHHIKTLDALSDFDKFHISKMCSVALNTIMKSYKHIKPLFDKHFKKYIM